MCDRLRPRAVVDDAGLAKTEVVRPDGHFSLLATRAISYALRVTVGRFEVISLCSQSIAKVICATSFKTVLPTISWYRILNDRLSIFRRTVSVGPWPKNKVHSGSPIVYNTSTLQRRSYHHLRRPNLLKLGEVGVKTEGTSHRIAVKGPGLHESCSVRIG